MSRGSDSKLTTCYEHNVYGGSSGTPAEQEYCKFFRKKYDGIFQTQYGWTLEVLKSKMLITCYGLRYYWSDTKVTGSGYITNTTSIFNFPVQGFATAEIIPIVLVWLFYAVRDLRVRLILTVHDSVIMEVHKDDVEAIKPIIAQCFTNCVYRTLRDLYKYDWDLVPLACEIKFGSHWSEGKGITASVHPNNRGVIEWKEK